MLVKQSGVCPCVCRLSLFAQKPNTKLNRRWETRTWLFLFKTTS